MIKRLGFLFFLYFISAALISSIDILTYQGFIPNDGADRQQSAIDKFRARAKELENPPWNMGKYNALRDKATMFDSQGLFGPGKGEGLLGSIDVNYAMSLHNSFSQFLRSCSGDPTPLANEMWRFNQQAGEEVRNILKGDLAKSAEFARIRAFPARHNALISIRFDYDTHMGFLNEVELLCGRPYFQQCDQVVSLGRGIGEAIRQMMEFDRRFNEKSTVYQNDVQSGDVFAVSASRRVLVDFYYEEQDNFIKFPFYETFYTQLIETTNQ